MDGAAIKNPEIKFHYLLFPLIYEQQHMKNSNQPHPIKHKHRPSALKNANCRRSNWFIHANGSDEIAATKSAENNQHDDVMCAWAKINTKKDCLFVLTRGCWGWCWLWGVRCRFRTCWPQWRCGRRGSSAAFWCPPRRPAPCQCAVRSASANMPDAHKVQIRENRAFQSNSMWKWVMKSDRTVDTLRELNRALCV